MSAGVASPATRHENDVRTDEGRSLKIALTADPELPVPPRLYGGIERIIDMLARGLSTAGHEVTLIAHPDSSTAARLIPWPGSNSQSKLDTLKNAATLYRTGASASTVSSAGLITSSNVSVVIQSPLT